MPGATAPNNPMTSPGPPGTGPTRLPMSSSRPTTPTWQVGAMPPVAADSL